jgi:hypothetical protein
MAPWSLLHLCPNYPQGHEESRHHGSCKDGMMGGPHEKKSGDHTPFSFESLPCTALTPATDEYNSTLQVKLPAADQFIIVAVLLNIVKWELPEQGFPLPDPQCNSDPPLDVNTLRGPPFISSLS